MIPTSQKYQKSMASLRIYAGFWWRFALYII